MCISQVWQYCGFCSGVLFFSTAVHISSAECIIYVLSDEVEVGGNVSLCICTAHLHPCVL